MQKNRNLTKMRYTFLILSLFAIISYIIFMMMFFHIISVIVFSLFLIISLVFIYFIYWGYNVRILYSININNEEITISKHKETINMNIKTIKGLNLDYIWNLGRSIAIMDQNENVSVAILIDEKTFHLIKNLKKKYSIPNIQNSG